MCFSANISLKAFLSGLIGSFLLIYYGNPKFHYENLTFGLFFAYVSFMQLFEFMFWMDLKNKQGMNEIGSILGSFFNMTQPSLLYAVKEFYTPVLQNSLLSMGVRAINLLYFVHALVGYLTYIVYEKLVVSHIVDGHLEWNWKKYFNTFFYVVVLAINVFYLTDYYYSLFLFIIGSIVRQYSNYYKTNDEIWCYYSAFIPLILLGYSFL